MLLTFSHLLSSLTLSSLSADRLQRPTMSFINEFLQQTIYLGMPDESVRNSVTLWLSSVPVAKANHPVFFFFFPPLPVVCSGGKIYQAEFRARRGQKCDDSENKE